MVGSWNETNEQSHYSMEMVLFLLLRLLEHRNNDSLLTEALKGQKREEVMKRHIISFLTVVNSRNFLAV